MHSAHCKGCLGLWSFIVPSVESVFSELASSPIIEEIDEYGKGPLTHGNEAAFMSKPAVDELLRETNKQKRRLKKAMVDTDKGRPHACIVF